MGGFFFGYENHLGHGGIRACQYSSGRMNTLFDGAYFWGG
jgi:hypothetical protein